MSNETALTITNALAWPEALTTFLARQNSPQTQWSHRAAVEEALNALGVSAIHEVTPPTLIELQSNNSILP